MPTRVSLMSHSHPLSSSSPSPSPPPAAAGAFFNQQSTCLHRFCFFDYGSKLACQACFDPVLVFVFFYYKKSSQCGTFFLYFLNGLFSRMKLPSASEPVAVKKRKRSSAVWSGPYIVYMLTEEDIDADMRQFSARPRNSIFWK